MKKKVVTKIGDIFSVRVGAASKKFFQLIAFDLTQLNSDVIRAFKEEYPVSQAPNIAEIVTREVEFYSHCIVKWGVQLGYWEKVGKSDDVGEIGHIVFRDTEDYATVPGEKPITVSNNWHIWRIGDEGFTDVGRLTGENRTAEIGLVFDPESIVHRMKTGEYPWSYPDFE